jgi:V/A-type H+-transporting ATPase subunit B
VDELASLSRLMRQGAGPGRTRADHLDVAAQTLAALASARRARELAELIGSGALSQSDLRYQDLERAFENDLMNQGRDENRSLEETLRRAWRVLGTLPRRDLVMLPAAALDAYYPDGAGAAAPPQPAPAAGRADGEPAEAGR